MKRIIEQTEDGSATLFVPELDEHYHSVKGARTESQHIFIEMGLRTSTAPNPRVLEVGFGTGLNALLTLEAAEEDRRMVYYTAIEQYPLTWEEVQPLGYSNNIAFQLMHSAMWERALPLSYYFTIRKIAADAHVATAAFELSYFDIVYFDAFAPEKQPEMWSESMFKNIYDVMSRGGILMTYCAKGEVRRMMETVGFQVQRLAGPPDGKREILRAIKI